MNDPDRAYANPVDPQSGFVGGGAYLSCWGDQVGVRKAESGRIILGPGAEVNSSGSSLADNGQAEQPPETSSRSRSASSSSHRARSQSFAIGETGLEQRPPATNDGGKVKKAGRLRSVTSLESPIARPLATNGRKRGLSTASKAADEIEELALFGGNTWQQDAGEAGAWTIVSTGECRITRSGRRVANESLHRDRPFNFLYSTSTLRRPYSLSMQSGWLPGCFPDANPCYSAIQLAHSVQT